MYKKPCIAPQGRKTQLVKISSLDKKSSAVRPLRKTAPW